MKKRLAKLADQGKKMEAFYAIFRSWTLSSVQWKYIEVFRQIIDEKLLFMNNNIDSSVEDE